ncbi:unnamed protein product [Mytilus coruscus]|uniref:Uncharacterized protein n=1 Tax=Mytilus coruscus TaxID=42192 RepID=A0A6J8BKU0_MYTCO|nr:unnamed protein product [Mytilus coruscus]
MRENWKIVFSASSLCNFRNYSMSVQRKHNRLNEFDVAMSSLQNFGTSMLTLLNLWKGDSIPAFIIYRMIHKHLSNSAKKVLILMFLQDNKNILASLIIVNRSNKRSYLGYKECLSRILIETFFEAESGWLFLAAFCYSTQHYDEMSCILELSSNTFSFTNRFVDDDVNNKSFTDMSKLKKIVYSRSFIKRMKFESSRVFHIDCQILNTENYPFLTDEIPGIFGRLHSHSLFFFLKFLYSRKQRNTLETQSALQSLTTIFEEESEKSTDMSCLLPFRTLLAKAFELSKNPKAGLTCTLRFLEAFKRSDEFETMVPFLQEDHMLTMLHEIA